MALAAALIGLQQLHDNSFLTHLATGRLILEAGSVPGVDPYSFTAPGAPWVVQSWLASVAYATAESVGGLGLVRLLHGAIAGALALAAWALLRPVDRLLPRLAAAALFLAVGAELWSERPLMFGLLAFAIVLLAAEDRVDVRWLVPVGWLWANTHGSFPLGLVYLLIAAAGTRLDGRSAGSELRSAAHLGVGILLGAIGPIGLELITFPVGLLTRQEVLSNVIEWQAPTFQSFSQRAFLVQLMVTIVLLARQPSTRGALLVAVFTGAALLGARNLPVTSLVLLVVLSATVPEVGSIRSSQRMRSPLAWAALAVAGIAVIAARLEEPHLQLGGYPVDALAFVESRGWDTRTARMAAPEMTGNLMTLVYGPEGRVFYDDRFDMYPSDVSEDQLALTRASPGVRRALDRHDIDIVIWPHERALSQLLSVDEDWRIAFVDEQWTVACRRSSSRADC